MVKQITLIVHASNKMLYRLLDIRHQNPRGTEILCLRYMQEKRSTLLDFPVGPIGERNPSSPGNEP